MVHNGIEYGLMQAYAEGFDIMRNADSARAARRNPLRFEIGRHCRSLAPGKRGQFLAAGFNCHGAG